MSINYILYVPVIIISFFLFLTIYLQNRKDRKNISYSLLVLCTIVWLITVLLTDTAPNIDDSFFWGRLTVIGPIFIPSIFYYFAFHFPYKSRELSFVEELIIFIFPTLFLPFIFTDLNIISVELKSWGAALNVGILYYILFTYYLLFFSAGFFNLYKKFKIVKGRLRSQLKLILFGIATSVTIGIITNVFLVIIGDTGLSIIGPPSIIFVNITTAIAILKYGFLDIRFILGKFIYFALLAFITYFAFNSVAFIYVFIFGNVFASGTLVIGIIIAVVYVIIYNFINVYIKENIDIRIINPGFNPNEEITRFNTKISSSLNVQENINTFLQTISKTIRPSYEGIVVFPKNGSQQIYEIKDFLRNFAKELIELHSLIQEIPGHINFDLLEVEIQAGKNNIELKAKIEKIYNIMKIHELRLIFKLESSTESFSGLLLIGRKDVDASYTMTETKFLSNLSEILSVSLARSQLYSEVQEFNKTLQQKVNDATAELKVKNDQLAESLRKERDMMDILGHELRTPLGTARNSIVMIEDLRNKNDLDQKKFDKYMEIALDNIRREKDLLQTILQSARLENDRLQINPENIKIADVIEDGLTAFKRDAEEKGLELKQEEFDANIMIRTDRTAIQQIVDNLISNAIKYTHKGSITVFVKDEGSKVQIGVRDTGEGISKENIQNIGKKFYRINPFLEKAGKIGDREIIRPGGTGIGLYVVKGLLKAMGSELEIESELGKGSVFSFRIDKGVEGSEK